MDSNQLLDSQLHEDDGLSLTPAIRRHLTETAWWGKFLAIVNFVGVGIFVIAILFGGIVMLSIPEFQPYQLPMASGSIAFMIFMYLTGAVLYFFMTLFLYRFSRKMQLALKGNDTDELTDSFGNLSKLFRIIGVLTIISLIINGLVLIMIIIGGAAAFSL